VVFFLGVWWWGRGFNSRFFIFIEVVGLFSVIFVIFCV